MVSPDFGKSVNPIYYYLLPRIFRPSYGPDTGLACNMPLKECKNKRLDNF
jgi:hypothetical protein